MKQFVVVALFGLIFAILGPLLLMLVAACWLWTAALAVVLALTNVYKNRRSSSRSAALSDGGRLRAASRAS